MLKRTKREYEIRIQAMKEYNERLLDKLAKLRDTIRDKNEERNEDLQVIRELREERDALKGTVEQMTREAEKLQSIVRDVNEKCANLEAANRAISAENERLCEHLRATECPDDCKHKQNHNACRTCMRYPHARDKYEQEAES